MAYTDPPTWVAGNPLPAGDLNTYVRDNFRWLHDKGADLASATTLTITSQFHKVTGTTTVDNIAGPTSGHEIALWFTGACPVRNNGGGTGNIRLQGGADRTVAAGTILLFKSDGTVWQEVGTPSSSQLAYVEFTAPVTVSAATEAAATVVVTAGSVTYDGVTPIIVTFYCPIFAGPATVGENGTFVLWDDTAGISLGYIARVRSPAAAILQLPVNANRRLTPVAGARVYSIRGFRDTGNWAATAGAGAAGNVMPGFIRIAKAT